MTKDYTPLIGRSVYDYFRNGEEEMKITRTSRIEAAYPIGVEGATYTTKGKTSMKQAHGILSTTPYNPLTGAGVYTPFDADALLEEILQEKAVEKEREMIGKICVFTDEELPTSLDLKDLYHAIGILNEIKNGEYMRNSGSGWKYCRLLTDFDPVTGELISK